MIKYLYIQKVYFEIIVCQDIVCHNICILISCCMKYLCDLWMCYHYTARKIVTCKSGQSCKITSSESLSDLVSLAPTTRLEIERMFKALRALNNPNLTYQT